MDAGYFLLGFQGAMVVLYSTLTQYGGQDDTLLTYYDFFQHVHVMVFVGFGFLMAYLASASLTSLMQNFLIGAMAIQWAILTNAFWERAFDPDHVDFGDKLTLSVTSLIGADFMAGAALIAWGAVLGRVQSAAVMWIAVMVPIGAGLNEAVGVHVFHAVDMGGSMFVHLFGAVFGVCLSRGLPLRTQARDQAKETKVSNTFAMAGTLFLWMYWPSFNGALAEGNPRHIVVINTVLALAASCVTALATSRVTRGHVDEWDLLNATLAGGVAVGSSSDLVIGAGGAVGVGTAAGFVCVLARRHFGDYLWGDTAGVAYLHGLMGLMGGLGGVVSAETIDSGDLNLNPWSQGKALLTTLGVATAFGFLTSGCINLSCAAPKTTGHFYRDSGSFKGDDSATNHVV